jgi:hypothetical protein
MKRESLNLPFLYCPRCGKQMKDPLKKCPCDPLRKMGYLKRAA